MEDISESSENFLQDISYKKYASLALARYWLKTDQQNRTARTTTSYFAIAEAITNLISPYFVVVITVENIDDKSIKNRYDVNLKE